MFKIHTTGLGSFCISYAKYQTCCAIHGFSRTSGHAWNFSSCRVQSNWNMFRVVMLVRWTQLDSFWSKSAFLHKDSFIKMLFFFLLESVDRYTLLQMPYGQEHCPCLGSLHVVDSCQVSTSQQEWRDLTWFCACPEVDEQKYKRSCKAICL